MDNKNQLHPTLLISGSNYEGRSGRAGTVSNISLGPVGPGHPSGPAGAAVTKHPRPGASETAEMYRSQVWRLDGPVVG